MKRLEQGAKDFIGYPGACISDSHDQFARIEFSVDGDFATCWHGLNRVNDQVGEYLIKLAGIGVDERKVIQSNLISNSDVIWLRSMLRVDRMHASAKDVIPLLHPQLSFNHVREEVHDYAFHSLFL